MTDISNIGPAGGVNTTAPTISNNQVGTPNANTVNALQSQLSGTNTNTAAGNATPTANNSGISAADMKLFMDEVNKFCVQQGISTTPKATRD